jgi:hypothetical protein
MLQATLPNEQRVYCVNPLEVSGWLALNRGGRICFTR